MLVKQAPSVLFLSALVLNLGTVTFLVRTQLIIRAFIEYSTMPHKSRRAT